MSNLKLCQLRLSVTGQHLSERQIFLLIKRLSKQRINKATVPVKINPRPKTNYNMNHSRRICQPFYMDNTLMFIIISFSLKRLYKLYSHHKLLQCCRFECYILSIFHIRTTLFGTPMYLIQTRIQTRCIYIHAKKRRIVHVSKHYLLVFFCVFDNFEVNYCTFQII